MPAGAVEEEDGVDIRGQLLREGGEEQRHGLGRHARQGQGEGLVSTRPAGGEEIKALEALVSHPRRADATLVPAMARPALLADPRLVLTPELDSSVGMRRGDGGEPRAKSIF